MRRWTRNFFQAQAPFGLFDFAGFFTSQLTTNSGGNAIADMLLGLPIYSQQDSLAQMDYTTYWESGFYAQDDWKVARNFTLNLGLRYEIFSPVGGRVGNFDLQKAIVIDNFGPNAVANAGVKYDLHDFGPRVGFAWTPFGADTVIRAAGGIFYAPEGNIFNDLGENPPTFEFYSSQANPAGHSHRCESDLQRVSRPACRRSILFNPSGEVKTTGPRRLMPAHLRMEFRYPASAAGQYAAGCRLRRHQRPYACGTTSPAIWTSPMQPLDSNFGPAPNYGRPYYSVQPNLSLIYPIDLPHFDSFYNGLEVKFEKRFSNGLTFRTAYTWSKDLGTGQGTRGRHPEFRRCVRWPRLCGAGFPASLCGELGLPVAVRARKDCLARNWNRATDLILGGWDLNGIAMVRTGEATTAIFHNDYTNTGSFAPEPDIVGNPYNFSYGQSIQAAMGCPVGQQSLTCFSILPPSSCPPLAPGQKFAHEFGNATNGDLRGPDQVNFDLGLMKDFSVTERQKLSLRAEVFNIGNHPQFELPNNAPDIPGGQSITATLPNNQREIQFALKWNF